jgi:hypothetical protein
MHHHGRMNIQHSGKSVEHRRMMARLPTSCATTRVWLTAGLLRRRPGAPAVVFTDRSLCRACRCPGAPTVVEKLVRLSPSHGESSGPLPNAHRGAPPMACVDIDQRHRLDPRSPRLDLCTPPPDPCRGRARNRFSHWIHRHSRRERQRAVSQVSFTAPFLTASMVVKEQQPTSSRALGHEEQRSAPWPPRR